MDNESIVPSVQDRIGIITLNRPDRRNAISIKMRREISHILSLWKEDHDVGAVIITGSGSTFSAGFDLGEFKEPNLYLDLFQSSCQYHRDIWYFPKPTLAAVNGPALAGGFDLAKLCDIRICSPEARFGHPEIRFAPTLYTPLKWIVGAGWARDLCLTGRFIDAAEAHRIGLVSEVVDGKILMERSLELIKTILAAPSFVLHKVKKFFIRNDTLGFEESFAIEHDATFQEFLFTGLASALKET